MGRYNRLCGRGNSDKQKSLNASSARCYSLIDWAYERYATMIYDFDHTVNINHTRTRWSDEGTTCYFWDDTTLQERAPPVIEYRRTPPATATAKPDPLRLHIEPLDHIRPSDQCVTEEHYGGKKRAMVCINVELCSIQLTLSYWRINPPTHTRCVTLSCIHVYTRAHLLLH